MPATVVPTQTKTILSTKRERPTEIATEFRLELNIACEKTKPTPPARKAGNASRNSHATAFVSSGVNSPRWKTNRTRSVAAKAATMPANVSAENAMPRRVHRLDRCIPAEPWSLDQSAREDKASPRPRAVAQQEGSAWRSCSVLHHPGHLSTPKFARRWASRTAVPMYRRSLRPTDQHLADSPSRTLSA